MGFHGQSKLKRAAINMIIKQMSEDQLSKYRQVFNKLDGDHSGTIDKKELQDAMAKSTVSELSKK